MSIRLTVALDSESVRKLLGRVTELLKGIPSVDEVGESYIVVKVPRLLGFGTRRIRLDVKVYETDETILLVMKGDMDSLVIAIDILDTGEGSHILVSGGGGGRVSKLVNEFVKSIAEGISKRIEASQSRINLVSADNSLAALEEPLPPVTTLVYYDSFTPVSNVLTEAALRLTAVLGYDDYLAEVKDYKSRYLLRFVLRGNKVTGIYAEINGKKAKGEQAIIIAQRPPGHRVRIKAWSLTGSSEALLYEPEPIYESTGHRVYWVGGKTRPEYGGIAPNTYIIIDNYEAAIINPSGDERLLRGLRNLIGDMDYVRYILLTHAEADVAEGLRAVASKVNRANILATSYWAGLLASAAREVAGKLAILPARETELELGSTKLLIIPARTRGAPVVSIYDPTAKVLFTGNVLGAVSPPGLWSIYVDDFDAYLDMVKSYVSYTAESRPLREWLERVTSLDIEVLAPHHGPMLTGRARVRKLLSDLLKYIES